ncbi:MAG: hypothetical protein ACXABY_29790 [Candidatus Thorarchaeota archaeon]|jgi:hypothetical protein
MPKNCEFCNNQEGYVELEVFSISGGEVVTTLVCTPCAVLASGTRISYDNEGIPYSNLGCIGGSPEEVN